MEGSAVVFRRSPIWPVMYLIVAAMFGFVGMLNLVWFADVQIFAFNVVIAALWVCLGLLFLRPYATVSPTQLVVNVAPARPSRTIEWSAIRALERPRPGKAILRLQDGRSVKLYISYLTKAEREPFVALLQHHVGHAPATHLPESSSA